MDIVENKTFYHIYREVPWNPNPLWEVGKTYFIGKERNPFIKFYDIANISIEDNQNIQSLHNAINHYQKYVREQLFEEVRREFFPNLPSRYKCLWVIEDDVDTLKYWWEILGRNGIIVKLNLTGKLHKANDEYLELTTRNHDFIRQQAFKYWSGSQGSRAYEIVFEGFATVQDYLTLKEDN